MAKLGLEPGASEGSSLVVFPPGQALALKTLQEEVHDLTDTSLRASLDRGAVNEESGGQALKSPPLQCSLPAPGLTLPKVALGP